MMNYMQRKYEENLNGFKKIYSKTSVPWKDIYGIFGICSNQ